MTKTMKYGSDIPGAREDLLAIARRLRDLDHADIADEINAVVTGKMLQRKPKPRTPTRHGRVTDEQVAQVKVLLRTTNYSHQQIAERVGVNPGRVSEIYHGGYDK